jgi:hypothetical protein
MVIKNSELGAYKYCLSLAGTPMEIPAVKILKLVDAKAEIDKLESSFRAAGKMVLSSFEIDKSTKEDDEKWKVAKPKLNEISEVEVELINCNFLTKEEVVSMFRGQKLPVLELALKYLAG